MSVVNSTFRNSEERVKMSLDEEIKKAIQDSVQEMSQPDSVAQRLIAWLEAMSNSQLSATEKSQRLDLIYQAINIEELENSNED